MTDQLTVEVELFKESGKWGYTETWQVPENHGEGAVSMRNSPDYRNIGGPVLIPESDVFTVPHLLTGATIEEQRWNAERAERLRLEDEQRRADIERRLTEEGVLS
ncbi:hypothetical protein [Curtobacterium sp. MCSS17_016]|uniref:hypothetical protein n=1 Tax=Curtobacterium sp. MCSS17_016 TaxID=2175644 RepID=UPI000DAA789B|nr:hypothetical protein [Curtobacterium sp. MCSS17_016]WIE81284.1 hypothetical protein DEJ19_018800 [Curtobacterium sp. MCSS17_016]